MQFKKTLIAIIVAGLCNSVAYAALPDFVITNGSSGELTVPNDGQLNEIVINTNNQNVDSVISIGSPSNYIQNINVVNGFDRDQEKDKGLKVSLDFYVKKVIFGGHGVNFDNNYAGHNIGGSSLCFNVDTFTSNVSTEADKKFIALSAGKNTSVLVNATRDVRLEASNNVALAAGDKSRVDVVAENIFLTANSGGSFGSVVNVNGAGVVNLTSKNNIIIDNKYSRGGYGIQVGGAGQVTVTANNTISMLGDTRQNAVYLNQSNAETWGSENGSVLLKADNVNLNGYVYSSMKNKLQTNGVFFDVANDLVIQSKNNSAGAIHEQEKGFVSVKSSEFYLTNESVNENSSGIYLENAQSEFDGRFKSTSTINASTGIFVKDAAAKFSLAGDSSGESSLTIKSALAAVVSKSQNVSFKDTSLIVNLSKSGNLMDRWYTPIQYFGIAGIDAIGGNINISNTNASGKILTITVEANSNANGGAYGDKELKTSALAAINRSAINVQNFDDINLSVTNTGSMATNFGLRSDNSTISMTEGIGTVHVVANEGCAVYSTSAGQVNIKAKTVDLKGTANKGIGLNANSSGNVNLVALDKLDIAAKKAISVESVASKVIVDAQSTESSKIAGDWSVSEGSANVTLGNQALVEGDLTSNSGGKLNLTLGKKGSFTGSTSTGISLDGDVNLTTDQDSTWLVTKDSTASALNLTGTTVDFSRWNASSPITRSHPAYRKVTAKSLSGDANIFRMRIDLANEASGNVLADQFDITGKALGTHTADLMIDGRDLVPEKFHSENWLISQGSDSNMSILNKEGQNVYSGRGMVTTWGLSFVADGEEEKLNSAAGLAELVGKTTGTGVGKWYLVRNDEVIIDPNPNPNPPTPPLPPEVNNNITIGTSSGQAEAYQADMEDLRKRTGEVRYGAQDGGWVSVFGKKDSVKASGTAGFKQEIYGLNIGVDRLVHADEDSAWLLGGAFRYSDADQKGLGSGYTTGTLQEYSGKLYATWMHDKGSYADFVLQAGRYEQELEGFDNTGMDKSKADYGTWGFGASVEVGHMFLFDGGVDDRRWFNHWFVEPQLQLSYFLAKGADYTTSTGLKVDQGNADFLTGRAGFVLGKKFNYGTVDDLDRRYFQVALLGGVKHEFLGGDQTIFYTGVDGAKASVHAGDIDGTRFYYGVNCDWQVTDNFRLYAQASREEGDRYTKDYDISIGGKLLF